MKHKCGQRGADDKASATAIIKRYVFGIVGVEVFAHKRKLSRFKNKTRHDHKNIPFYNCGCGGEPIFPVQKMFRLLGSAFGSRFHVVYGVNNSCIDQQRNLVASLLVWKFETRITRGGICGSADCGSQKIKRIINQTINQTTNQTTNQSMRQTTNQTTKSTNQMKR